MITCSEFCGIFNFVVIPFLCPEVNTTIHRLKIDIGVWCWSCKNVQRYWSKFRINHLPCFPELKCSKCTPSPKPIVCTSVRYIFTVRRYAKRGICRRRVSVCLSVTLRYCIKTAKRRITHITPHDSPMTLVFWCQRSWRNSNGQTTSIFAFFVAFHIFAVSKHRDFIVGVQVDRS